MAIAHPATPQVVPHVASRPARWPAGHEGRVGPRRGTGDGFAVKAYDLTKVYGRGTASVTALDGVTLGLRTGEFTSIMGPSGSGKSTLLHLLAGLDSATSGRVFVGPVELGRLRDRALTELRRDRIGFVFQSFNLVPTLTAAENIALPLDLAGRQPDPAWFDHVVASVGIGDRLDHRPSELSGGQQQRVAIARALITRPEVIFADEPTGNLDSATGQEVLRVLREAVDTAGQTVVMVTHDPFAAARTDRALILADGRVRTDLLRPSVNALIDVLNPGSAR